MDKRGAKIKKLRPNQAADLIRQKISSLYSAEPDAKQELAKVESTVHRRSKHQQFMHELVQSGKSMAEIQTTWHSYYVGLPDDEKHQVWREFYSHAAKTEKAEPSGKPPVNAHPEPTATGSPEHAKPATRRVAAGTPRTVSAIKKQLLGNINGREKLDRSSHFRSILFGLGMGGVVVVILLFGFFNERIIAPFITPSRTVSSTPIITDPGSTSVGPEPKIIIPKINVEIPVVYNEPSVEEDAVQKALERGVLHYATTPQPGQTGNSVIFGHSSNNILNPGKYKFAFVLLSRMETGDTFMLQRGGKRYVYRVFDKKIVNPTDLSVLGSAGKRATATLITCDPPGTTINRLVVIGEQISPDPAANVASTDRRQTALQPEILPSDAPSFWEKFVGWFRG